MASCIARRFFIILAAISSFIQLNDAITCYCDDCSSDGSPSQCEEESGGACYSRVVVDGGTVNRQKRCYDSMYAKTHCNIHTNFVVIECCFDDYCNKNLNPSLPGANDTETSINFTSTYNISETQIDPADPAVPTTEEPPDDPAPLLQTPILCNKFNTKPGKSKQSYCTAPLGTGSCYHLIRKLPDGSVDFERYGCMENCMEENRNRAIRKCCNSSWCNEIQNPPVVVVSTENIQLVSSTIIPHTSVTETTQSTLKTDDLLASSPQFSIPHTTLSGLRSYSSDTVILTTSSLKNSRDVTHYSSSSIIITSSHPSPISSMSHDKWSSSHDHTSSRDATSGPPTATPSTTFSSSSSGNLSPTSMSYVLGSVLLGVLYIIILTVVGLLVTIVCYKQRKTYAGDKNSTVERSTDTLVSRRASV